MLSSDVKIASMLGNRLTDQGVLNEARNHLSNHHHRDLCLHRRFVGMERLMNTWPFPPPTGPVPWTSRQERAYQKALREKAPPAPF